MSDLDILDMIDAGVDPKFAPAMEKLAASDWKSDEPPKGFKFWYDTLVDCILENPLLPLYKIAEKLGRSSNWVYLVCKSDSFKEHYEWRRRDYNDRLTSALLGKASAVAVNALDILLLKLEENPSAFTPSAALEVSTGMMKMLGMGQPKAGPTVNVQQTTVVAAASPDELRRARELIRSAEASQLARPTLEIDANAAPDPQPNSE